MKGRLEVKISAARVGKFLVIATTSVVIAHIFFQVVKYATGHDFVFGLTPFFDLWAERNLPSWYSTILLAVAGMVSALAGIQHRHVNSKDQYYWLALALVFAFLSLDEAVSIHERLIVPLREALNTSGFLSLAWILPYGTAVIIIGIVYFRFWWRLPRTTRLNVFLAGAIFLSGALGIESLSGYLYEQDQFERTFRMDVVNLIEESMEMFGMVLFIHTVFRYIAVESPLALREVDYDDNSETESVFKVVR